MAFSMLKEFGITPAMLSSMETEEQKEDFIVLCMRRKIEEDYEKWKKEHEKTEKDMQKKEFENEHQKTKFEKEKSDVFQWLRLKTKYFTYNVQLLIQLPLDFLS